MALIVVRGVEGLDPNLENYLTFLGYLKEYDDGNVWLENDHPWDAEVTWQIMEHSTNRFAVADEDGAILAGPFRSLDRAERARATAKVTFQTIVDVDEDEEPEAEVELPEDKAAKKVA